MTQDLNAMCELLCSQYTWSRFEPSQTNDTSNMRYLVACIATSGDAENRVMAFLSELGDVWNLGVPEVTALLACHHIKYPERKAGYIVEAVAQVRRDHNGRLPMSRRALEALPGVGRHIASVVLATLGDENEFAVDYHVRRVFTRLGINPPSSTDQAYERLVASHIEPGKWGHFSRAVVDFGQDICGQQPRCHLCKLDCPSRQETFGDAGLARQRVEGVIVKSGDNSYSVTIRSGRLTCTCKGYRFARKCRHVQAVADRLDTLTQEFETIDI